MADVEVDLYSGRPNPHATLDAAATAQFVARVDQLAPSGRLPTPPPLGYRGLRVCVDEPVAGTVVEVFGGVVTLRQPDAPVRILDDPHRETESWLVDVAASGLDSDMAQYVRDEVGR
jgi:hypothetical protein